jgi:AmpD protein
MNPPSELGAIDPAGWLVGAQHVASPNHDERPSGTCIALIVIHAISLPPGQFGGAAVSEFFTNRLNPAAHPYFGEIAGRRVSAHFYISRSGLVTQFVSCLARAWHAGISCWHGRERCNDFSLGIELEGDDLSDFEEGQYCALNALLERLRDRYPDAAIAGHADIAPGRKTDPGPHFEWSRIAHARVRDR